MVESTLNRRSFALTMLIVVLFTSGMLWLNRDSLPVGYTRYEKYGLNLVYPEIMDLRVDGFPYVSAVPSESDGLLVVQSLWENKLGILEILWIVKDKAPSADVELAWLLAHMSQQGTVVSGVGEGFDVVLHGETVRCINIEVDDSSNVFSGIVGVVYRPWSSTV